MIKFIIRRLLSLIPVILGVTFFVFMVMQLAPGDAAKLLLGEGATQEQVEELREEMGLNDPVIVQYVRYMVNFCKGDLGTSYATKRPVADEVFSRFPYTFNLSIVAGIVSILLAIPLGILAAVKQNTFFDNISMVISLVGVSMPIFWLGMMLVNQFSVQWGLLPALGRGSLDVGLWDFVSHMILPCTCLATIPMATFARITRSSMLEVIHNDSIKALRARGISERSVIWKHALKNALPPIVTVLGLQIASCFTGAILTESIFSWPGMGTMIVNAINNRDYMLIQGVVLFFALVFVVVNLLVDIAYMLINPRVSYEGGSK